MIATITGVFPNIMSTITQMMNAGANVQLVVNVTDLKELFLEWQSEIEASKQVEKEEEYKTPAFAAEFCGGVDRSTLWRWAKSGYLVPVKVGAKSFYRMSDLEKLMGGR